jgi:hypothetical protein
MIQLALSATGLEDDTALHEGKSRLPCGLHGTLISHSAIQAERLAYPLRYPR